MLEWLRWCHVGVCVTGISKILVLNEWGPSKVQMNLSISCNALTVCVHMQSSIPVSASFICVVTDVESTLSCSPQGNFPVCTLKYRW